MCAANGARVTVQDVHQLCRLRRLGEAVPFLPLAPLFLLPEVVAREAPGGSGCAARVLKLDRCLDVVLWDFHKAISKLAAANVHCRLGGEGVALV